jgi:hypothetical protein
MKVNVIDALPAGTSPGRHESALAEVVRTAQRVRPQYVEVTADPLELIRLYKAMIQYRSRHADANIQIKKTSTAFYVWIDESVESSGRRRANTKSVGPSRTEAGGGHRLSGSPRPS